MAKAYYFNYIPASDTSRYPADEATYICDRMAQILIDTFQEYGLHVKDHDYFSCGTGEKLLSDEKSLCCIYPDKCDMAWDHSTWGYDKDRLGEIFVCFKKDNRIVISFGTDRIAKRNTNEEIISGIRNRAVAGGILPEESVIYEMGERMVEKHMDNIKKAPDKAGRNGEQVMEKTDEKTVYKKICHHCNGKGRIRVRETVQSFSRDRTNGDTEQVCTTCNGAGYVIVTDYVGKYRTGKKASVKELDDYLKEECKIQDKIFDLIEQIKRQYAHVTEQDSFWLLMEKEDYTDDRRKEEEKTTTYSFILDSAGNLRCTESFETIRIIGQGTQWWRGKKGDVGFRDFDEYMREFDFHANGRYSDSSFLEYTHLARDYEGYACRSDSDMAILERNYEKGYGLYYALKSILEEGKLPQNPDKPVPVADKPKESASKKSGSGGCYVATAVYGSYDCPEVWTLRRYRDDKLARTFWGRSLIRIYYTVSPTVVRLVGNTGWFHRIWRRRLDKMVRALRERGFDSTPYEDRPW